MEVGRREAIAALTCGGVGAAVTVCEASLAPGRCAGPDVAGFTSYCFTDTAGTKRQLYVVGEGPPVVLLHELPGLIDADLHAARRLAGGGYTVVAPLFFGTPGGEGHALRYARQLCGREQFACNKGTATSPHTRWLRELMRDVRATWPQGAGVGVIGMCLTGAFPLALLREDVVLRRCRRSPLSLHIWTRSAGSPTRRPWRQRRDPPMRNRSATRRCSACATRSTGGGPRFRRLAREFGGRFYRLDLPGKGHSTLGAHFCDHAFQEISAFLNRYLRAEPLSHVDPFPLRSRPGTEQDVLAPACTAHRGSAH
jgi:hypothetical protein